MKTITKLLAILLVFALLFSLAACGDSKPDRTEKREKRISDEESTKTSELTPETDATEAPTDATEAPTEPTNDIVGTWKHNADLTAWIEAMIAQGNLSDNDKSLLELEAKMFRGEDFPLIMDLREDGSFSMALDEDEMEKVVERIGERMPEYAPDILAYALGLFGMTTEEYEAMLAAQGMTLDEALAQMCSEFDAKEMLDSMTESMSEIAGTYTFENGTLTLTNEKGEQEIYKVELSGDTLTITEVELSSGLFPETLLPWIFTR